MTVVISRGEYEFLPLIERFLPLVQAAILLRELDVRLCTKVITNLVGEALGCGGQF